MPEVREATLRRGLPYIAFGEGYRSPRRTVSSSASERTGWSSGGTGRGTRNGSGSLALLGSRLPVESSLREEQANAPDGRARTTLPASQTREIRVRISVRPRRLIIVALSAGGKEKRL